MSHSVFKEYAASPFELHGGSDAFAAERPENVVIVLNKDGTVSVDQHALHTFLRKFPSAAARGVPL